jgi:phosphopantetheinyl transferase
MIKFFLLKKSTYSFRSVIHIVHSVDPKGIVTYDNNGKAVIRQSGFHLGISHSDDWAVLGVGEENLGVDIQRYKVKSRDFVKYITGDGEMSLLLVGKIWAIKESFVKWLGTGRIGIEPNEIYIDFNLQRKD